MWIATCFGCTLYYFYAFSGTNLLTRSHSASSVFSAVFCFRNPTRKISSKSGEIFSSVYKRSGSFRSMESTRGEPPGAHTLGGRGPRWAVPRCGVVALAGPRCPSFAYIFPSMQNPNTKDHIPRKVPSRPSSSISDRGSSDVLPAPCRRGNHHRGLLHHHACLRSDA